MSLLSSEPTSGGNLRTPRSIRRVRRLSLCRTSLPWNTNTHRWCKTCVCLQRRWEQEQNTWTPKLISLWESACRLSVSDGLTICLIDEQPAATRRFIFTQPRSAVTTNMLPYVRVLIEACGKCFTTIFQIQECKLSICWKVKSSRSLASGLNEPPVSYNSLSSWHATTVSSYFFNKLHIKLQQTSFRKVTSSICLNPFELKMTQMSSWTRFDRLLSQRPRFIKNIFKRNILHKYFCVKVFFFFYIMLTTIIHQDRCIHIQTCFINILMAAQWISG